MRLVVALALLTCAFGCRQILGFDTPVGAAIDAPIDAFPPGICAEVAITCANAETLRTCDAVGAMSFDTACGLGCKTDPTAHCGKLSPAGGGVVPDDLDSTGLADRDLDSATFDGSAGTINGSTAGVSFHLANNVAIFRFNTLHLTGVTTLAGAHPIALVAAQDLVVDGLINAQGTCTGAAAGPGGGAGGGQGLNGNGPGASGGTGGGSDDGGGGGGANGGGGGDAGGDINNPPGGMPFGDAAITTLLGGGGGGGGTNQVSETGGGGGGAIQLVANIQVQITALAGINAGGCGGEGNNCPNCDYAGGGAGGTILIESRQAAIAGALAVNGGGGGGAGGDGQDAQLTRTAAVGGPMSNGGVGGNGAAGAILAGSQGGDDQQRAGGGGGGIGRIRINTSNNSGLTIDNLHLSPSIDDQTTCTRGAVGVE